ncbi:translation initiation factor IF-2 [Aestuariispira insulae]|uniref:Translation initiation factor IF-2 n=1 Tax=Aestuariispira insulae TaxID=1461337 RepID=A0A3D9HPU0_9PROT|nr:translation initiation factor IF-2 [Aestuariispira insulae]RED51508.1 translation initiation factor 2 (bIF-2) [Aestuariispira insulae]
MSDSKDNGSKLTLGKPKTLELKKTVEGGQVRQSFSHGRSKTVTVEVKKKRTFERGESGRMRAVDPNRKEAPNGQTLGEDGLSDAERERRMKALAGAAQEEERRREEMEAVEQRAKEAAERRKAEEEERQRQAEEDAKRAEEEAKKSKIDEEEAKKIAAEAEERKKAEAEAAKKLAEEEAATAAKKAAKAGDDSKPKGKPKADKKQQQQQQQARSPKGGDRRRSGKLTINQALDDDGMPRVRSMAAIKRAREKEKQQAQELRARNEKVKRDVTVPEFITVGELANRMAERVGDVIKAMMKMGVMATQNQTIDADTAELVIEEFGHRINRVSEADVEDGISGAEDKAEDLKSRAPVVTIMGHVDHGKTSLLDALRQTDVAGGEAGGITQHIGAYQVKLEGGDQITFLDTPGHAAFTEMRMRGANVTDIVVLVVAADDGIQPQTKEAIAHSKAAEVPIIVAINKCDKPEADPGRIRNQLLEHELVPEELGGDIMCLEVSAKAKLNLDKLEEAILLQAEMLELSANPNRRAEGAIVEAKLEKGRGSVATVLVQRGTVRVGDVFVAGAESGRVRALLNDKGRNIEEAGPSVPVEVLGLQGTPQAGDDFVVVRDDTQAREIAEYRQRKAKEATQAIAGRGTLEQMFSQIKAGEVQEMPIIIKTDVQGSLEAITSSLEKMGTEEVKVRVLHGAVGGITESDITLAASTGGVALGFNVRANPQARELARRDGVDIRYYSVIYDLIDDMKKILGGLLAPELRETFLGYAEIREVFNVTKVGKVGGCYVTEGMVKRGAKVRLLRDDTVIHEGSLKTLRRFKDDVREVQSGYECGMAFENYDDIKQGDVIECFDVEEVAREL